jgi:hypothetical protein
MAETGVIPSVSFDKRLYNITNTIARQMPFAVGTIDRIVHFLSSTVITQFVLNGTHPSETEGSSGGDQSQKFPGRKDSAGGIDSSRKKRKHSIPPRI